MRPKQLLCQLTQDGLYNVMKYENIRNFTDCYTFLLRFLISSWLFERVISVISDEVYKISEVADPLD